MRADTQKTPTIRGRFWVISWKMKKVTSIFFNDFHVSQWRDLKSRLRQTSICTTWPSFPLPITNQLTVHYIHKKVSIFTPVSSIRISLYRVFICSLPILNNCHLEFDVCRKLDCKSLERRDLKTVSLSFQVSFLYRVFISGQRQGNYGVFLNKTKHFLCFHCCEHIFGLLQVS